MKKISSQDILDILQNRGANIHSQNRDQFAISSDGFGVLISNTEVFENIDVFESKFNQICFKNCSFRALNFNIPDSKCILNFENTSFKSLHLSGSFEEVQFISEGAFKFTHHKPNIFLEDFKVKKIKIDHYFSSVGRLSINRSDISGFKISTPFDYFESTTTDYIIFQCHLRDGNERRLLLDFEKIETLIITGTLHTSSKNILKFSEQLSILKLVNFNSMGSLQLSNLNPSSSSYLELNNVSFENVFLFNCNLEKFTKSFFGIVAVSNLKLVNSSFPITGIEGKSYSNYEVYNDLYTLSKAKNNKVESDHSQKLCVN